MPLNIVRNDITKMKVDVIVNAANTSLQMGGGVCGAIFKAAGAKDLQAECNLIGNCETGQAVITKGYELPAKFIIHTVGPIYHDGKNGQDKLLHNCYLNSLTLAMENGCESIAFPLISTGIYAYPKKEALKIATSAISDFLQENEINVYLAIFDKTALDISEKLLGNIQSFIDDNYVAYHTPRYPREIPIDEKIIKQEFLLPKDMMSFKNTDSNRNESFSQTLLKLIVAKKLTNKEVYKRANIDRRLFSKIFIINDYHPSKNTAIACAIALSLDLEETKDLLERAGYSLSRSIEFDLIIEYFIKNKEFNINEINKVLYYNELPTLGLGSGMKEE